jgi:hypothetical protein
MGLPTLPDFLLPSYFTIAILDSVFPYRSSMVPATTSPIAADQSSSSSSSTTTVSPVHPS